MAPLVRGDIDAPASVGVWLVIELDFIRLSQMILGRLR